MSKAFLERILKEELRILKEDSTFIRSTSDTKVHKFSSSKVGVQNEINNQLREKQYASPETLQSAAVQDVIANGAKELVSDAYDNIVTYAGGKDNVDIRGNRSAFSAITSTVVGGFSLKQKRYVDELTVFETLRKGYDLPKKRLITALNRVLKEEEANRGNDRPKQINGRYFLDLDHKAGSVISRQEVSQSKARLSTKVSDRNESKSKTKITDSDLADLGLELFISKKDTEGQSTILTGLRAAKLNRGSDSKKQKAAKTAYVKKLEEAVKKLNKSEHWAKRPGSDSRLEIERKKVIKSFDVSVKDKKHKNLTQKSKNSKPNYSNSTATKKVSKPAKKGTVKKAGIGALALKKARPSKTSANSTITLGALINQKLPATVAKNMGLPGLRYRTGRFAQSVRITDVTRTTKGFPSIGYTYMKYPYQTFEPGYLQGSQERDPRKLIDRSIREIAAELLVGRFYTRRV